MHIRLSPMRRDDRLTVRRLGDVLTINGEDLDLSAIPDGSTLPRDAVPCDWLASDIERIDGELRLTLILPHGARAPQETLFPEPMLLAEDGPVVLPAYELEISDAD